MNQPAEHPFDKVRQYMEAALTYLDRVKAEDDPQGWVGVARKHIEQARYASRSFLQFTHGREEMLAEKALREKEEAAAELRRLEVRAAEKAEMAHRRAEQEAEDRRAAAEAKLEKARARAARAGVNGQMEQSGEHKGDASPTDANG